MVEALHALSPPACEDGEEPRLRPKARSFCTPPRFTPPTVGRQRSESLDPAQLAITQSRFITVRREPVEAPMSMPRVRCELCSEVPLTSSRQRLNVIYERRARTIVSFDVRALIRCFVFFALISTAAGLKMGPPLPGARPMAARHRFTSASATALAAAAITPAPAASTALPLAPKWGKPAAATAATATAATAVLEPTYPAPTGAVYELYTKTRYFEPEQRELVSDAVEFASRAHEGQRRKSGQPFVIHPIEVACVLAELRMDAETIVAGLLHDVVEDTPYTVDDIASRFGERIAAIVAGVTDDIVCASAATSVAAAAATGGGSEERAFSAVPASKAEADLANQRELLIAMSSEWRVVMVKLADRLHNMRTLSAMPRPKQVAKARETLSLFVPLARMVGVSSIEAELRALSAQYLSPLPAPATALLSDSWLGQVAGSRDLLDSYASAVCPATLDTLLESDAILARRRVEERLARHRQIWTAHCRTHQLTRADADGSSSDRAAGGESEADKRASRRRQESIAAAAALAAPAIMSAGPAVAEVASASFLGASNLFGL